MSLLAPPPPFPPAFNFSMLPSNLNPNDANPPWMSKGDNAWQLIAATLVGMQSVPGLIILYGGAVKKKWAVNSAFMALYAFACVLVCWVCWGYRLSFGEKLIPIWGKVDVALEQEYLFEQAFLGLFPNATMVFFQFVFAAITLILIAGALLGRMNFYAWMLFVPLWLTFSYTIGAYTIWSTNGWLSLKGIIDYSGGYVIHLSSGVAGFTAAYWVRYNIRFPTNHNNVINYIYHQKGEVGWNEIPSLLTRDCGFEPTNEIFFDSERFNFIGYGNLN